MFDTALIFGIASSIALIAGISLSIRNATRIGTILSAIAFAFAVKNFENSFIQAALFFFAPPLLAALSSYSAEQIKSMINLSSSFEIERKGIIEEIRRQVIESKKRKELIDTQTSIFEYLNNLSYRFGFCKNTEDVKNEIINGAKKILNCSDVGIIEFDYLNTSKNELSKCFEDISLPCRRNMKDGRYAIVAVLLRGELCGGKKYLLYAVRESKWTNMELRLLFTLSEIGSTAFQSAIFYEKIEEEAVHDALTGLATRRAIEKIISKELALSRRAERLLAVSILDIDRFKKVNDTWGHEAGDDILCKFGNAIKNFIENREEVKGRIEAGRYGGEEFIIICRESDSTYLASIIDMLRETVKNSISKPDGTPLMFSAGVCEFPLHGSNMNELFLNADKALYHAKASGRDRVRICAS